MVLVAMVVRAKFSKFFFDWVLLSQKTHELLQIFSYNLELITHSECSVSSFYPFFFYRFVPSLFLLLSIFHLPPPPQRKRINDKKGERWDEEEG